MGPTNKQGQENSNDGRKRPGNVSHTETTEFDTTTTETTISTYESDDLKMAQETRRTICQMIRQRARDRRLLATLLHELSSSSEDDSDDETYMPDDSGSGSESEYATDESSEYSDYASGSVTESNEDSYMTSAESGSSYSHEELEKFMNTSLPDWEYIFPLYLSLSSRSPKKSETKITFFSLLSYKRF